MSMCNRLLRLGGSAVAAMLVLTACAGATGGGVDVAYERITAGYHSGIYKHFYTVIDDKKRFATIWKRARAPRYPTPPPPAIDFSRYVVIGLFAGEKRTGGYHISVKRMTRTWSGLRVVVRVRHPGEGCATTQSLTQPFVFVKTRAHEMPVKFVTQYVSKPCD